MTASRGAGAPISAILTMRAHAIVENARNAIMLLLRAPSARAARLVPAWRRHLVHGVTAAVTIALAMILVDQRAYQFASGLPLWLVDGFYAITDFGRSGWILVPTGGLILVIALLASPALDHMTRGVLAMLVVRIGFIFIAVGLPGLLVTIVKRWIGRVRRPEVRLPMNRFPGARNMRACPRDIRPRRSRHSSPSARSFPARDRTCGATPCSSP
jgi:hypothetical protein